MELFYAHPTQFSNNKVLFSLDETHHIKNTRRYKIGDAIDVVDGVGNLYKVMLEQEDKKQLRGSILNGQKSEAESNLNLHLAQALPKGKKFDEIVDGCTQIGVKKFIPFISQRTIVKYDDGKKEKLIDRWNRIAISAMKQSGRAYLPKVDPICQFTHVLSLVEKYDLCMIASAFEEENFIKTVLQNQKKDTIGNILIIIGPEGGFSQQEIDLSKEAGCKIISLGKRILRTELAGVVTSSIVFYEME